jgi:hypothetical protein
MVGTYIYINTIFFGFFLTVCFPPLPLPLRLRLVPTKLLLLADGCPYFPHPRLPLYSANQNKQTTIATADIHMPKLRKLIAIEILLK